MNKPQCISNILVRSAACTLVPFVNQGLLGITIPAEAGGIGGTFLEEAIVEEEQSYAQAVSPNIIVHSAIVMPYFYNYGTPEQGSIPYISG